MEALKKTILEGLPIEFQPWQVLFVMALFVVLVPLLDRLLYRRIFAVLDERRERIEKGQSAADESEQRIAEKERQVSEKLARARTDAVARLDAAKKEAEAVRSTRVGEARDEADARLAQAREAVEKAAEQAAGELRSQAGMLSRRIASRLLGREVA